MLLAPWMGGTAWILKDIAPAGCQLAPYSLPREAAPLVNAMEFSG